MKTYDRKVFQLAVSYCHEVDVWDQSKIDHLATQIQEVIDQFIENERRHLYSPSVPPARPQK